MKIFSTAIALTFALPAAAQTAPAPAQHQGHAQHQQHGSGGHAGHGGHQAPQGQQGGQHGQHGQHQGHATQADCCADRNGNGRMDCCETMAADSSCCCQGRGEQAAGQQPAQPQSHQNH